MLLGLVIGSFLNVVVCRLPVGISVWRPASRCPSCLKGVHWFDNLPVLSWLLLRGRCRHCRAPISIRYPLIEFMTAVLFLAAWLKFGTSIALFARDLPFLAILVAVTFIDLEHRIIPDELSLGGLVWGLLLAVALRGGYGSHIGVMTSFGGAFLGFFLFFALSWCYLRISGRVGLGGGDVKLLAMLGAFLGPAGVFATILISSVSGSVVGIAWALWCRRRGIEAASSNIMSASIPYGPFLVIGALYYYLLGDVLWFQFTIPT
jgi:leader peptidase (prepilin peptidase)/N-methyltransferase